MEYFDIKQLRRRQGFPGRERKFSDGGADRRRHEKLHDRGRIDDQHGREFERDSVAFAGITDDFGCRGAQVNRLSSAQALAQLTGRRTLCELRELRKNEVRQG